MQVDDPPYLSVGTAVSAKYKGAFCEAKVSKVDRVVKCKVTFKSGLGTTTVSDNEIKGTLRVGHQVLVKHSEHKEPVEATITKIQDCSQYTVVFDDGDITTLRRTALCLKSGRHFNESETLDQLPLTHPEHFSIPVMGSRRGRRNRLLKDESSDEDVEEEDEPDLEGYTQDIGRVVSVETGESKRGKEKWFPGLIVIPSAQPTVKINVKDEFLIRSFRDDRYYTVPKKEVSEFHRDSSEKIESSGLLEAIQKANKYLSSNDLPLHWEKSSLFNVAGDSDSDDNVSDESGEEQSEEKDLFVAQLYKFMDDAGTPLNKTPTIAGRDIDLHRLFRVVDKMGGYNRVTNQNKWKSVVGKMKVPISQNASNQIKSVYKKCLLSYEGFFRTLGVTMSNPIKPNKKDKGRSLIRDKDRTPMSSPRPERDDDIQDKPIERKSTPIPDKPELKTKKKETISKEVKEVKKPEANLDAPGTSAINRPKRYETPKPVVKDVKKPSIKPTQGDKVKVLVEKFEDATKKDKDEKIQFTRSKSLTSVKPVKDMVTTRQSKEAPTALAKAQVLKPAKKPTPLKEDEDKKSKSKKKLESSDNEPPNTANIGDKLIVYYGPTNESKVTYEAKVVDIDKESPQAGTIYLVHYTGWNTRYDEWIPANRIAENLTSGSKSRKAGKIPAPVNVKQISSSGASTSGMKTAAKRSRLSSVSSKEDKPPRSTTPSSVTSSGSVSKSPATPVVRSSRLAAKQEAIRRRVSAHTDVSDIDSSESEPELSRTRSGSIKSEELEVKVYRKRISRGPPTSKTPTPKRIKKEDEEDSNKDDDSSEKSGKRVRKKKSSPDESEDDESESGNSEARGRDFDLNQIRSELKGFAKALKTPPVEVSKESSSSDDSSEKPPELKKEDLKKEMTVEVKKLEEEEMKPSPPKMEVSSSSDDIYEFKEPEPFEFETRSKLVEDKVGKKRLPRLFGSLSPSKNESKLDLPEPRTYSRVPKRVQVSEDEEEEEENEAELMEEEETAEIDVKNEDPFDKLIESPSFNLMKGSGTSPMDDEAESLKNSETKPSSFHDALFKEPETSDEYSRDMELSDCEFPTQIFTREDTVFSASFSKSPNDRTTPDFSSSKTDEGKTTTNSDDEDIQAQIQRVIAQSSSTDDDSGDALVNLPSTSKKVEVEQTSSPKTVNVSSTATITHHKIITVLGQPLATPVQIESENKETTITDNPAPPKEDKVTNEQPPSPKKPIDPALQETDSSLLESIVSKPPLILNPKLDDTGKELTVKTGTRIADSILQKFNSIKNNMDMAKCSTISVSKVEPVKVEVVNEPGPSKEVQVVKEDIKEAKKLEEEKSQTEVVEEKCETIEPRRRRRVVSKAIIEESDSDSSDSEHLVIGSEEDEEDSRTNSSDNKPLIECKNTDSNLSSLQFQKTITTTDDSQSQPAVEEKRSFSFEDILPKDQPTEEPPVEEKTVEVTESDTVKTEDKAKEEGKEEQDPNLHSLLLCEEEIPRSPAPVAELPCGSDAPSVSSVHEMPFASAPGTSNSSKILLEPVKKQPPPPLLMHVVEKENRADAQVVIENTPPTTPESTISNLSPRGDNGTASTPNASPNSNEDNSYFPNHRASSSGMAMKISPYSEEDTQPGDLRKPSDNFGGPPMVYRKRRRSLRNSEDGPAPIKRGRKPRRRDSDSDASESSAGGGTTPGSSAGGYERSARSPRPSKYNFFVEFDPSLDSSQRIAVLQQKLSELRKAYADVKAELATVERRRKKLRRREREVLLSYCQIDFSSLSTSSNEEVIEIVHTIERPRRFLEKENHLHSTHIGVSFYATALKTSKQEMVCS